MISPLIVYFAKNTLCEYRLFDIVIVFGGLFTVGNVMTPSQRMIFENAERERELVCDWLLGLMAKSQNKPATKDALREIALKKFNISKASFDHGWNMAIMKSGNEHWWEPLPRRNAKSGPVN